MRGWAIGRSRWLGVTMCLLAVLFHAHPEAPVVIAANRDERYARAAEAVQVLRPSAPRILGRRYLLPRRTLLPGHQHGGYAGPTHRPAPTGPDPGRRSPGRRSLAPSHHNPG